MSERQENGTAAQFGGAGDAPDLPERVRFEQSMREFTESASALTAASLRLQMMMLEQVREMLGEFSEAFGDAAAHESKDD